MAEIAHVHQTSTGNGGPFAKVISEMQAMSCFVQRAKVQLCHVLSAKMSYWHLQARILHGCRACQVLCKRIVK